MNISLFLSSGTATDSCNSGNSFLPTILIVFILLGIVMFVMPLFNKRKDQEKNEARNSISVGDVILTIGGIIGTVIDVETTPEGGQRFTIETGTESNKSTLTFDINALYSFISRGEIYLKRKAEEDAAKAEAERLAKEAKLAKKKGGKDKPSDYKPPEDEAFSDFGSFEEDSQENTQEDNKE